MNNTQEYIESGLLEQYALGELPAAERAAVEAEAAAHPAIAAELAEIVAALDGYAQAHAIAPPPAMRARVLSNVLASISAAAAPLATTAPTPLAFQPAAAIGLRADIDAIARPSAAAPAPLLGQRPVAPLAGSTSTTGRSSLAIAASVALLLSLLGNFFLYSRWHEADTTLVALQADQTRLASANTVLQREMSGVKTQNDILRDDRFKVIALAGTPDAPSAKARVFFDPRTRKVYLDAQNMPALPAGKQYQLWALRDGKPVDAGMVVAAAAARGLQEMKAIEVAQAFAVTVEPVGGSVGPTMPIQAMGAVTI